MSPGLRNLSVALRPTVETNLHKLYSNLYEGTMACRLLCEHSQVKKNVIKGKNRLGKYEL